MPGSFGLVLPPWNHSPDPGNLLDRVLGEVGIDHLSVPAVTGELFQFRLSGSYPVPHFHTEGGWHFPPETRLYASAGTRPRPARWLGTRDPMARLCDYAARQRLEVHFRVDLPAVRSLIEQSAGLRCHSAWGDELQSFGPCVCNPEFRELLRATLVDLTRYEPAGFALHNMQVEAVPLARELPELGQVLLGGRLSDVCYCPACRQIATLAGVDAEAAAAAVRERTERLAACSGDELYQQSWQELGPVLSVYRSARAADLRRWLAHLAPAHPGRKLLLVCEEGAAMGELAAADASTRSSWLPLVSLNHWLLTDEMEEAALSLLRNSPGPKGLALPVWDLHKPSADRLVRFVSRAGEAGVVFFDFEKLEESPREVVTWLKQAVRYARRGER